MQSRPVVDRLSLLVSPSTAHALLVADGQAWATGDVEAHFQMRAEAIAAHGWYARGAEFPVGSYVSLLAGGAQ